MVKQRKHKERVPYVFVVKIVFGIATRIFPNIQEILLNCV